MDNARTVEGVSRRTLVKGAAWSLPVIAVAAATPMASASATNTVEGFSVDGTCGLLGVLGPGFTVKAGTTPIPVGTSIQIHTTGLAKVDLVSLSGQGLANVTLIGNNDLAVTLTSEIPAQQQMNIQWLLSVTLLTTTTATLTLPTGYVAGQGTKAQGGLSQTLVLCNAS